MLEKNEQIIQKIIELKNIDFFELLRYGLNHQFIDGELCSGVALKLISENIITDNPYLLELASLVRNDYENQFEKAQVIILEATKKGDGAFEGKKQLYNKVWFYLFQLNDLLTLNIVQ